MRGSPRLLAPPAGDAQGEEDILLHEGSALVADFRRKEQAAEQRQVHGSNQAGCRGRLPRE